MPLLVVIDLQEVFADPGSPWFAPRFAATVPRIRQLLDVFGSRAVFTRFVAPSRPVGAWVDYYRQWPFALQPAEAPLWNLVPDVAPGDRPVLDSTTFGKWDARLASMAGDAGIVLAGVSTDCCVLSTALAAADAGTPVLVASDACAGASDEDHQRALDAMALYAPLVTVTSVATVVASLGTTAAAVAPFGLGSVPLGG